MFRDQIFQYAAVMFRYQIVRYATVGGLAFLIDSSILISLTELAHIHYLISAAIGFIVSLAVHYMLSIRWVFSYRSLENPHAEFAIFTGIGIIGLALTEFLLWFITEKIGFHYMISKLFAVGIVFLFNYYARKYTLFREQPKPTA